MPCWGVWWGGSLLGLQLSVLFTPVLSSDPVCWPHHCLVVQAPEFVVLLQQWRHNLTINLSAAAAVEIDASVANLMPGCRAAGERPQCGLTVLPQSLLARHRKLPNCAFIIKFLCSESGKLNVKMHLDARS